MTEEALQIVEKRREEEGKEERERYTQMNAEFQRIARRYKNVFFSEQCKEVEENNRMGKARDLFKKIGDFLRNVSREHFTKEWAQLRTETART